jgi:hypothetical protein
MPNRKTFDDREKYDHSSHRTAGREKGDLAPVPNQEEERSSNQEEARAKNKNPRPRTRP